MNKILDDYIEMILKDCSPAMPIWNIENIRHGKKPSWNYIDGCLMASMISLYEKTNDKRYIDFAQSFVDYYVAEDGSILGYDLSTYNLDDINEGRVLFDLYKYGGQKKYRLAIERQYEQIKTQPRNAYGSFWHKKIYPQQVWLDGLYMAQVFYTRYETEFNDCKNYSDIINQFDNVEKYMRDEKTGLYYHGFDCTKQMFWANESGLSANFWLRSNGWYNVAMIDVIGYLADGYGEYKNRLSGYFKRSIDSIIKFIEPQSHMLYQVIDMGGREGNYLETSGSAMIAYAILKGVRLGVLPAEYKQIGLDMFDGICEKYLTVTDGRLDVGGICLVAGLGPDNNRRRDGSYEYYVSEPIVSGDAKGVAPLIMAYSEIKQN